MGTPSSSSSSAARRNGQTQGFGERSSSRGSQLAELGSPGASGRGRGSVPPGVKGQWTAASAGATAGSGAADAGGNPGSADAGELGARLRDDLEARPDVERGGFGWGVWSASKSSATHARFRSGGGTARSLVRSPPCRRPNGGASLRRQSRAEPPFDHAGKVEPPAMALPLPVIPPQPDAYHLAP